MAKTECIGCGSCCRFSTCPFSADRHVPCRHLVWRDGRYWCGVYEQADGDLKEKMRLGLRIGIGCAEEYLEMREKFLKTRARPKEAATLRELMAEAAEHHRIREASRQPLVIPRDGGVRSCHDCEAAPFTEEELQRARLRKLASGAEKFRPTLSVVIAALNEHEHLPGTLESIRATGEADEIIVGDDCSDPPLKDARFRNPVRVGMARTRHVACKLATADVVAVTDGHIRPGPHELQIGAGTAWEREAFVYATPTDYPHAEIRNDGIPHCKWASHPLGTDGPTPVDGIMGGMYFVRRDMLDPIGGWPALPGWMNWEEEFWALYCAKAGIPIVWLPKVHHWHLWRTSVPQDATAALPLVPYESPREMSLLNLAAVYRLLHDDTEWAAWRQKLIEGATVHDAYLNVPEWIIEQVETPELEEYGRMIRLTYDRQSARARTLPANQSSPARRPWISVVIPSRNEGGWLERTVASIRRYEPAVREIIHVDDNSMVAEPDLSGYNGSATVKQLRMERWIGAARARAAGFLEASQDAEVIITCDAHMLFGAGEGVAALLEETERFKRIPASNLPQNYRVPNFEIEMVAAEEKLSKLAKAACDYDCLAYMSPCRHSAVTVEWENDLIRVKWAPRPKTQIVPTAGIYGGCYAFSRNTIEQIGGYPQLPGGLGFEEETLVLLAIAHRIPILCLTDMGPWHVFRGQGADPIPTPYSQSEDRYLVNLAAVYRLCFDERMWRERWRPLLATRKLEHQGEPCFEYVLREVEAPNFTEYRDAVQATFELTSEEILRELEQRRAADAARARNDPFLP